MSVATVIAAGRRAAESRMSDACTIGGESSAGAGTWDPITETYIPDAATIVYSGKCRVKKADTQAAEPDVGDTTAVVVRTEVDIPVGSYTRLRDGLRIVIDSAQFNPLLWGVELRITNVVYESQGTALRIVCTQVQ